MTNIDLLSEVGHHKSVFSKAALARYEDARPGSLRLLPNNALEAALRRDYVGIRSSSKPDYLGGTCLGFDARWLI